MRTDDDTGGNMPNRAAVTLLVLLGIVAAIALVADYLTPKPLPITPEAARLDPNTLPVAERADFADPPERP